MTTQTVFLSIAFMIASVTGQFSLVKLPSSTPVGGKCLDGTSAGFYIREGVNPKVFVINLEGGGFCANKQDCTSTAMTNLGSSTSWPDVPAQHVMGKNKLLSSSCDTNPDFCDASTVFVPYCTGDVHTGTRTMISEDTWGFHFDGHHNFVAIIDMLFADYGLGEANQQVLLTGVSAGGIGTFLNVDYLADSLPSAEAKKSNLRHRPIGIGVLSVLADSFLRLGLSFSSENAKVLNEAIFETIYHAALEASAELAE